LSQPDICHSLMIEPVMFSDNSQQTG